MLLVTRSSGFAQIGALSKAPVNALGCGSRSPRGSVDRNAFDRDICRQLDRVAPRAGAWIETRIGWSMFKRHDSVAPRAGAWIETHTD